MATRSIAVFGLFVGLLASLASDVRSEDASDKKSAAVAIGTTIDDLRFVDIRGLERNLPELGEHQAIVFAFTSSSCPLVRRYMPRLKELDAEFRSRGVQFVAVNVGANDTVRDTAAQAVDLDAPFYFVKDLDFSVAKALGVRKTPEVVILDSKNVVRYRGRIDDQIRTGGARPEATRHDLKEALTEVLDGKPVSIAQTEVDGCLITEPADSQPDPNVTWSSHIAHIVHQKCTHCHRSGTAAPFELVSRDDMANSADMIAHVVRIETMPPWYATRGHGEFQNDASLSASEKQMLLDWIQAGCPAGDLAASPEPPKYPDTEWRIGEPDLILTMKEEHTLPATGFIPYKYVILPHFFAKETWVEAFEIKPMNTSVVHHCNMFHASKEGAGVQSFITGYVPGGQPMDLSKFDNGVAYRLPPGASLGLQIHYTTTGVEEVGRIQVGLRFPRGEIKKKLHHFVLDPQGWAIPPGDPAFKIQASHTLEHNANLLGMFTHMHVRGRDMTFFADQDGQSPETLLQIPNFSYEWQLGYELATGKKNFPKGTKIRAIAHYDNSPFNPYNPDPTDTVKYGPQVIHEMFNGFAFYVDNDETLSLKVDPVNGQVIQEE